MRRLESIRVGTLQNRFVISKAVTNLAEQSFFF